MVINGRNRIMKNYVLTVTDSKGNIIDVTEGVNNILEQLEGIEEDLNGCETYEEYEAEKMGFAFSNDDEEYDDNY
jgi:hypothetical protein